MGSSEDFGDFDLNSGIESTLVVAWNEIKYVSEVRKNLGQLPLIRANGSELNQVILNILVNAAHAISSPGGHGQGRHRNSDEIRRRPRAPVDRGQRSGHPLRRSATRFSIPSSPPRSRARAQASVSAFPTT